MRRRFLGGIKGKNNIIYYTSTDNLIIVPYRNNFGTLMINNKMSNNIGIMTFLADITTIGDYTFYEREKLKSITIPNSVTEIGWGAFFGCTSLTGINIPDSATKIREYAFYGCTSITSITIPDSVTEIGDGAFHSCDKLKCFYGKFATPDGKALISNGRLIAYAAGNSAKSYKIPNNVTEIGDYAFYESSLTSITIPDSVTTIGMEAFSYCTSFKSVTIPDSVTEIGWGAFFGCTSLTGITIPDNVTLIGNNTFRGCSSLTSITIPDSVVSIGESAFYNCSSLTSITIPNSVTSIGTYTFRGCSSLTSITIPDGVTSIGTRAFYNCSSLTSIYCKATTPPSLGNEHVFGSNGSGRKIYVPYQSLDAYKTATYWSEYAADIVGYDFENDTVVEGLQFPIYLIVGDNGQLGKDVHSYIVSKFREVGRTTYDITETIYVNDIIVYSADSYAPLESVHNADINLFTQTGSYILSPTGVVTSASGD